MRALRLAAAVLFALPLTGATEPMPPQTEQPAERKFYVETKDDAATLDTALANAAAGNKLAVVVFGGDWCHDSRALAKALTSKAFVDEFGAHYSVVFVDVGVPQAGQGRNLELVARYGVKHLASTPALFVISPKGKRLNSKNDALSWRNADSRGEAAILKWFRDFKTG